jgi:hypothetical protein
MATYTETTTLDEVVHNLAGDMVQVTWRNHLFKDGVEMDEARTAVVESYPVPAGEPKFTADLGAAAAKYLALFQP